MQRNVAGRKKLPKTQPRFTEDGCVVSQLIMELFLSCGRSINLPPTLIKVACQETMIWPVKGFGVYKQEENISCRGYQ